MSYPPSVTSNPELGSGGAVVSICYNSSDHGRREIEQIALKACPQPAVAVTPWRLDVILNECPLFKKTRISFKCVLE
jgi:hypothetical protein